MNKNTTRTAPAMQFIAKLLVLCMIVGMIPAAVLGLSAGSTANAASYYGNTQDVQAPETSGGETVVAVEVKASVSGETASATVNSSTMTKAVDSAIAEAGKKGTDPTVVIEVDGGNKTVTAMSVALPTSALKKLAEDSAATLEITSDAASIALDGAAVAALAGVSGTATVKAAPVKADSLTNAQQEKIGNSAVFDFSITVGGKSVDFKGGQLTVSVDLPAGANASDVVVYYLTDAAELEACPTSCSGGKVTFTTPHLSKYVVGTAAMAASEVNFTDVAPDAWYADAVAYCCENGLMNGMGGGVFAPNGDTTRGQVMTILARRAGVDTSDSQPWYKAGMEWAMAQGVSDGTNPENKITREQLAVMLWRMDDKPTANADVLASFADAGTVSSWATDGMAWAVEQGLIKGTGAALDAGGYTTRAQLATILMRYCEG